MKLTGHAFTTKYFEENQRYQADHESDLRAKKIEAQLWRAQDRTYHTQETEWDDLSDLCDLSTES